MLCSPAHNTSWCQRGPVPSPRGCIWKLCRRSCSSIADVRGAERWCPFHYQPWPCPHCVWWPQHTCQPPVHWWVRNRLFRAWNSSGKGGFSQKWKSKIAQGNVFHGKKKFDKHTFFFLNSRRCRQIEGTKLIFIMNFSVLDFFKFASRVLQIAQILVWTSKISWGWGGKR